MIAIVVLDLSMLVRRLESVVSVKRFNDHDGADSSGGISPEDYHTGQ